MVGLVRKHRLGVVVSKVVEGLTIEACEEVLEIMKGNNSTNRLLELRMRRGRRSHQNFRMESNSGCLVGDLYLD